jgi:putative transposase
MTQMARRLRADDVLQVLSSLFIERGPPDHIRSDNAPEFAARAARNRLGQVGVKTLFIRPGSP